MGKIEGMYENNEHIKKGDKDDDWSEKGGNHVDRSSKNLKFLQ